jgi:hypothetical protein
MSDTLQANCHILIKYQDGAAGYDLQGEKTDLKDLLHSLMQQDRVFASLCAVALLDYCGTYKEGNLTAFKQLIALGHEQTKK